MNEQRSKSIERHSGDYVLKYEKKNDNRVSRLLRYVDFDKTDKVADFGCGNGLLMLEVANIVDEYVGVDFSPEFIAAAEKKKNAFQFNNCKLLLGDINEVRKKYDGYFTKAFLLDFSEHVSDQDFSQFLQSIHSTLQPNAMLYLHTPNREFIVERMKERNLILKQFPEHIAVRTASENSKLLEEAGFRVDKVASLSHYKWPLKMLHIFSKIPIFGTWFVARLFIQARPML